jgi:hypothetical protein
MYKDVILPTSHPTCSLYGIVFKSHATLQFPGRFCVAVTPALAKMSKATYKGAFSDGYMFSISASCARSLFTARPTSRNAVVVIPDLAKFDFGILNHVIFSDIKPHLDSMQPPLEVSSVAVVVFFSRHMVQVHWVHGASAYA